ncbi:MAG: SMP-30/gluconolactonase/LRE family protein [Gluconacetobacter diazotrophicus]|nr:SMP-30/gluconolactonase/LRE family protein [Gluconacetobacter diazotrophicus]
MDWFETVDPRFGRYVHFNAVPERIAEGCRWTEGPVWFGDANCLLWSDIPNDRILRWIPGIGVSTYRSPSQYGNGNTRDREGRLITCSHGARAVLRTEHDGTITILADRWNGSRLNSPNDVVVRSDGTIWFTDPHYGIKIDYEGERAEQEVPCQLYRLDPATGRLHLMSDAFGGPNGLCFSPDERRLYVAETGAVDDPTCDRAISVFDVADDGARITGRRRFYAPEVGAADGFRCDEDGNLWTSAGDGVHCVSPDGDLLGRIRMPAIVSNVCWGGRHRSRLFICATTEVWAVHLNRRGAARPG